MQTDVLILVQILMLQATIYEKELPVLARYFLCTLSSVVSFQIESLVGSLLRTLNLIVEGRIC